MTDSGHTGGLREFLSHSAGAVALVCGLFFLLSFMYLGGTADPQSHARYIPVAVVDEDVAATLETPIGPRGLDMGSRITAGLLQNNDWGRVRLHVVDPEAAEEGLYVKKQEAEKLAALRKKIADGEAQVAKDKETADAMNKKQDS